MKDYSKMLNEEITWKSDAEILEFESKYKNYILNVLREKNVDEHSRQIIYDDILIKFSQGKMEYDSNIGKYETFLYHIIQNMTLDFFREKAVVMDVTPKSLNRTPQLSLIFPTETMLNLNISEPSRSKL